MEAEGSEDVLRFWFPELSGADHARMVRQFEWWFRGGADSAIVERFARCWSVRRAANSITGLSGHDRGWH